ncbi:MAG: hypothetical protein OHK0046_11770 [Anaerolineae bacterium]
MEQQKNRIAAAENITIEITPEHWRVWSGPAGYERGLLEALPGRSLRYSPAFAQTRRLPNTGKLPLGYIWQVVLGWSNEDEAWHLGLLLARDLADARGSRWCEIARWPDPEGTVFLEMARHAGESLAAVLERPFNFIPRREIAAKEPPLPELPLDTGLWTLERSGEAAVAFVRARKWARARVIRLLWYVFLAVVYVVLSLATLNADLALPNAGTMLPSPELLPYIGLGTAVVLLFMSLYVLYELLTQPDRIIVNESGVTALRGTRERWQMAKNSLNAVYVTQVINRRGAKRTLHHGEINLHLGGDSFRQMVQQDQQEEEVQAVPTENEAPQEGVRALNVASATTDLQMAALHVGKALGGVSVWYDQRVR